MSARQRNKIRGENELNLSRESEDLEERVREQNIRTESDKRGGWLPHIPVVRLSGAESLQRSCSQSADGPLVGSDALLGARQEGSCGAPSPLLPLVEHRPL